MKYGYKCKKKHEEIVTKRENKVLKVKLRFIVDRG